MLIIITRSRLKIAGLEILFRSVSKLLFSILTVLFSEPVRAKKRYVC